MMNEEEKTLPEAENSEDLAKRAREVAEDAAEVVSDAVEKARETAKETAEKAREQAKEVVEKVSETAKEVAEKVSERMEKAREQVKEAAEDVQEAIDKTPLGQLIESQKRALSEAVKAIEALIPEGTREHGEKALKEMIEGYRALLDMTAEQINGLLERAGLKRDKDATDETTS